MKHAPILTAQEWRWFAGLVALVRAGRGVSPSYVEIRAALGLRSKSSVAHVLGRFRDAGLIRQMPGRARAIELCRHLVPTRQGGGDPVLLPLPEVRHAG